MPVSVLKEADLRHNIQTLAAFCKRNGVELAPHVKTTMSPEIFSMQEQAGAWAATVATVSQARTVRSWGVERIVIANEITEPAGLRWLIDESEANDGLELYLWVDSVDAVELAVSVHREANARHPLLALVELGHKDGRTGCRTQQVARQVADAVVGTGRMALSGVSGFEGTISSDSSESTHVAVEGFLGEMRTTFDLFATEGLFEIDRPLITAGGSAYFDQVVEAFAPEARARKVLRSGCYVTHDCGTYARLSPMRSLRSALEIWGAVLSVPEPSLVVVGLGKRDASHDSGLPIPTRWRPRGSTARSIPDGVELFALNDHHAYLRDRSQRLSVGDLVGCCISHPCTTFDKWRRIHLVDSCYRRVGSISTWF